ncbi:MAG: RNA pyrophosphohydrolase [Kiloniellales bacterium]
MAQVKVQDLAYRRGVGMMLLSRHDLVFVARRAGIEDRYWQMPQGGIDEGESPRQAALRELAEEIGTGRVEVLAECPEWISYELPPDLVGRAWGGRYRGQTHKWFALRFTGSDRDIDLDTRHPEFSAWRWVEMERLPDLVIPFKRAAYERVVAAFRHLAPRPDRPNA